MGASASVESVALPHPLKSLDELPAKAQAILKGPFKTYVEEECDVADAAKELEASLPAVLLFASLLREDHSELHASELKPLVDAINHQVLHKGEPEIELDEVMKTLSFEEAPTEATVVTLSEWINCVSAIPRLASAIKLHVDPLSGEVRTYVSLEARLSRARSRDPPPPDVAALEKAVTSVGFKVYKHCYARANRNSALALEEYSGKIDRADLLVELKALLPSWQAPWDAALCDHDTDLNGLIDEDEWLDTLAREAALAAAVDAAVVPDPPPTPRSPRPADAKPAPGDKHVVISDTPGPAISEALAAAPAEDVPPAAV